MNLTVYGTNPQYKTQKALCSKASVCLFLSRGISLPNIRSLQSMYKCDLSRNMQYAEDASMNTLCYVDISMHHIKITSQQCRYDFALCSDFAKSQMRSLVLSSALIQFCICINMEWKHKWSLYRTSHRSNLQQSISVYCSVETLVCKMIKACALCSIVQ